MSICLLLIHDRPELVERTHRSLAKHDLRFDQVVDVDDTEHRLGFAGAIQHGWDQIETDWVFHLEGDFLFNEPPPIEQMVNLLCRRAYLAQVVLKRQAWNRDEKRAGGIVELHQDDFHEVTDGVATWTEHRRFMSTNPSVYSSKLCQLGWPQEPESEGVFTHRLLKDPHLRFAFWGKKFAPPMVQHIGDVRAGHGY